jgi:hypothetical protein
LLPAGSPVDFKLFYLFELLADKPVLANFELLKSTLTIAPEKLSF